MGSRRNACVIPRPGTSQTSSSSSSSESGSSSTLSRITLHDLGRSLRSDDMSLDILGTEKQIQCLNLERLQYADRISELSCSRAACFIKEQLQFVRKLEETRKKLAKPKNSSYNRSLHRAMLHHVSKGAVLVPAKPSLVGGERITRQVLKRNRLMTAAMNSIFKQTVRRAALKYRKNELGEQFDRYIRIGGLDDEEVKIFEKIMDAPGAERLLEVMAKKNMFKPEDSLARLHDLGRTVDPDQLFSLLEKENHEIPLLNIIEWKHVTFKKLENEGIHSVDPHKVNWAYVAERMELLGYYFAPMFWYKTWCDRCSSKPADANYVLELAEDAARNWKKIADGLGSDYTEERCKAIYQKYFLRMCKVDKVPLGKGQTVQYLNRKWSELKPIIEKLLEKFDGSFPLLAAAFNYANPSLTFTAKDLRCRLLNYDQKMRKKELKYSEVEDAILLVTLTQAKSIIQADGNFACLKSYLPWRSAREWTQRLRALTRQWYNARFTMEEDMKLLYLAKLLPSRWVDISKYFHGFDRKACRGHYLYIQKYLSKGKNLIEYHAEHGSKVTYFHYPLLKNMVGFLSTLVLNDGVYCIKEGDGDDEVFTLPYESVPVFRGFNEKHLPTEIELLSFLYSLDQSWLIKTCKELMGIIKNVGGQPRLPEIKRKSQKKTQTFDTFVKVPWNSKAVGFHSCCDLSELSVDEVSDLSSFSGESEYMNENAPAVLHLESPPESGSEFSSRQSLRREHSTSTINGDNNEQAAILEPPPKRKKPAGRKAGRLRQLRREVALSRWRKIKAEPAD